MNDIDLESIRLNDTLQRVGPTEVGDYDDDGVLDLMVKFDRGELIDMLKGTVEPPADVQLKVTGELMGETINIPFEGSDTIRVI